jgi:hypothetical protein
MNEWLGRNRRWERAWSVPANRLGHRTGQPRDAGVCLATSLHSHPCSPSGETRAQPRKREKETDVWHHCASAVVPLLHRACGGMWRIVEPISLSSCTAAAASLPILSCVRRKIGVFKPRGERLALSLSRFGRLEVQDVRPFDLPARHGHKASSTTLYVSWTHLELCHRAMVLVSTNFLSCPSGSFGCGSIRPPKAKSRSNGSGSPRWSVCLLLPVGTDLGQKSRAWEARFSRRGDGPAFLEDPPEGLAPLASSA